jgi:opacity protein-like surface antigen
MVMRPVSVLTAAATLTAAALALSPAFAADYPLLRGSQIDTAPPSPTEGSGIDWSGFYFGGHGGGTASQFRTDRGVQDIARGVFNGSSVLGLIDPGQLVLIPERRDNGPTFGAIAGYNMMIGDVVVGVEADYTRVNQGTVAGTSEYRQLPQERITLITTQNASLQDYASARIRLGWVTGNLLPFATAGVVAGRFNTNVTAFGDYSFETPANSGNYVSYVGYPKTLGKPEKDKWGFGFTVGGGVDYALTDNFLVRAEYLYSRFNNVNGITVGLNTARVAGAIKF